MNTRAQWLHELGATPGALRVDGLVTVKGYRDVALAPEQRAIMEKAESYRAHSVFFEASRNGRPPVAQAFVFVSEGLASDEKFADLHKRLWSWGGVPLVYRKTAGLVQLFRCAHKPDFEQHGRIVLHPFKILHLASQITTEVEADPWWDAERLRNGTLWDDPQICKQLLSNQKAAQKALISAVRELHEELEGRSILPKGLRRRLLILSILIAYLEARGVFEDGFFSQFKPKATNFFQVLTNGDALLKLLDQLEQRFNGNLFMLRPEERETLRSSSQLQRFAQLVEGRQERGGQLTLWQRYSFADLPVELISHIYQLFVKDSAVEVYTPHFIVRLMVGEVLSWENLDRLEQNNEVILDGACGSGIFLVEAYKRLVLHWRYRNDWKRPPRSILAKLLITRLRGIDKEEGAVELAAFSLCLALCDALEPKEIRTSIKLFPPLKEKTIHTSCFFEALERQRPAARIGIVIGNPPFTSKLGTEGAQRAYERYQQKYGALPDKQLAYLFLHEAMGSLASGGVLCMLQQYNFLYNQQSIDFRRSFIQRWDVREIFDFISVRGLFHKGGADTKVLIVIAEARSPSPERQILHATFRRTGRTDAEQGFDIDYYDMHWVGRQLALQNDAVWRANSVGGGRVLAFVERLKKLKTLANFAEQHGWDVGEGWIEGKKGKRVPADFITGHPYLPSHFLTSDGLEERGIQACKVRLFKSAYTKKRYTPPLLLVRSQSDFHHAVWEKYYLTYTQRIVGFAAPKVDASKLRKIAHWLEAFKEPLQAYLAATSPRIFTQKSSALSRADITSLPYDPTGGFCLTPPEGLIASDIVLFYREMIREGEKARALTDRGAPALVAFNEVFVGQINGIYRSNPLVALEPQYWPGVVCQPYAFGDGSVSWSGADDLKDKIDKLLREERGGGLEVTRVARIYDSRCIYLLKPDRLRYWLRSIALRDADETLADLVQQGY